MFLFLQMGQDQSLPVSLQHIFTAGRGELQTTPWLSRLQQQMHLRVMAQRLIMPYALHSVGNGLPVYDAARTKLHPQAEAFLDQTGQYLQLYLSHKLHMDLPQQFIPYHMQLGILLFQLTELHQRLPRIHTFRQDDLVCQKTLHRRMRRIGLGPQPLSRIRPGQSCNRADHAADNRLCQSIPRTGIDTDLIRLLSLIHNRFDLKAPSGNFDMSQSDSRVPCDLIDLSSEFCRINSFPGILLQSPQQLPNSAQTKRRAKIDRKESALPDHPDNLTLLYLLMLQKYGQHCFITDCHILQPVLFRYGKVHTRSAELILQFLQKPSGICPWQVHFIDKQKNRDPISLQQAPQGTGVALHPIRTVDYKDRIIQHLKRTLHLTGKIHMSRRIQQKHLRSLKLQHRLFGEDRDPARTFLRVRIQKRILMIDPSQRS